MRLFGRWRRQPRFSSFVFAASDADIEAMDIARGPTVDRIGPRGGRRSPLISKWLSLDDSPERMEVLFRLLSDRPADPWAGRRKAGHATLFRFSVAYAEVLAALGPFHPPDADRDRACSDLAAAWLRATIWPKAQTAAAVEQHLHMYTEAAIISQRDGVGLHYWFGPEVPLRVLVSGPGNKSWDFEKT